MPSLRLNSNYQQEIAIVARLSLSSGMSQAKLIALSVRLLDYLEERDSVQLCRDDSLHLEYDSINDQRLQELVDRLKENQ